MLRLGSNAPSCFHFTPHRAKPRTNVRSNVRVAVGGAIAFTLLASAPSACSRATPTPLEAPQGTHASDPQSANVDSSDVTIPPNAASNPSSSAEDKVAPTPSDTAERTEVATASTDISLQPALVDSDGNPLPQTDERPSVDSPSFKRRLESLVAALSSNQPELARPAFFPQLAYTQVKAIKDPARDWDRRLFAAFSRNIADYHARLGKPTQPLTLVRLELPEAKVKWIKPGVEGNRLGYYRVTRSKLVVAKADGQEVALELTSLISWRGEWYVVHLHGFE